MVYDKVCFHCRNLRIGWQLVVHGVKYFHYDDCIVMMKAPLLVTTNISLENWQCALLICYSFQQLIYLSHSETFGLWCTYFVLTTLNCSLKAVC
jgi:hypothetical protein